MAFNEPLMLEPAYARVFFCALAGQLGISRLTDAVSGDSLAAGEAPATLALSGDDDGPRQARSYQVMNGIAVLPVSGTLVSRTRALQPYSGMTGYNGIIARLQQAASDPMVDGILLDMDTPGGMVAGAFDCADIIARVRDIKPVWALANDMNCSAGQLLASAASRRLVTQTARTGSIGVMMAHSNYGAALEKQGVEITLIYSGSHTTLISLVDGSGNPVSVEVQSVTDGVKVKVSRVPDGVAEYSVWGLKLPTLRQRLFRCVSIRENDDGTYAITAVQHVPEKEAIVDNGAHFDGDQSGTVNGVTPPAVQHLTAEVTADSGEYQVLARWDTPKVVKGVSFMLRLTVTADDGSERLVSTARTTETTYRFRQLALGRYTLTVRAVNAWGQQGDPA
ncbi:phage tail tip protein J-related protein, partial [Escherichia coli]